MPHIAPRQNASNFWRGFVNVKDQFHDGLIWRVGNGEHVRFWRDRWISGIDSLENYVNVSLSRDEREARVAAFVCDNGNWNTQRFCHFLPDDITSKIISMQPPSHNASPDCLAWRHSTDGMFSVKSAYDALLNHDSHYPKDPLWKLVWRWDGPPKIKSFLWLCNLDRLSTMSTLYRRNIMMSNSCPMGCQSEENVLHCLRDCTLAAQFWKELVDDGHYADFFGGDMRNWMVANLSSKGWGGKFNNFKWEFVFVYGCWTLWKNRCSTLLEGKKATLRGLLIQCHLSLADHECFMKTRAYQGPSRLSQIHIRWVPPIGDGFKFNVDGSVHVGNKSACGGVLRDRHGVWVCGFSHNIGTSTITMAELMVVLDAMKIVINMGVRNVIFESDSSVAVHLVSTGVPRTHPCSNIIMQIHSLAPNFSSEFQLQHTFREANTVADCLANHGHNLSHGLHEFHNAIQECSILIANDRRGLFFPRDVLS